MGALQRGRLGGEPAGVAQRSVRSIHHKGARSSLLRGSAARAALAPRWRISHLGAGGAQPSPEGVDAPPSTLPGVAATDGVRERLVSARSSLDAPSSGVRGESELAAKAS